MNDLEKVLERALQGVVPSVEEARALADCTDLPLLLDTASQIRDRVHHQNISYSRKVFIPLTQLCRDVCHYCTFTKPPVKGQRSYLTREQILEIARAGAEAGCHEALFTLGDKPELRYRAAREELSELGYETTLAYLADMADLVFKETGLLPHVNPGIMTTEDLTMLRKVSVSMGIMLESASERLTERGMPHFGSPDKKPEVRLETIRLAGELKIPFTSGILIGIGETRLERIESLLALRDLHQQYGHIQELIIQNFRAKPDTKMANAPEPDLDELLWTLSMARVLFGESMNIQAPPNLSPGTYRQLIKAGLNDWGGVSPVTPDHVNPEARWPGLDELATETNAAGKVLVDRLPIYPVYVRSLEEWVDPRFVTAVIRDSDAEGFARVDPWSPGEQMPLPEPDRSYVARTLSGPVSPAFSALLDKAQTGVRLSEQEIVRLLEARGNELAAVCQAADDMRKRVNGDVVSYVVNRNINYTNICYFRCQFCAFSKGKLSENLRGTPYDLGLDEVMRRAHEAWDRGATEVCMQGGIHPDYTGDTYLNMCRAIKEELPEMHIHAFSPLEVWQGAQTLGITVPEFLVQLKEAGLSTLPGTAAEILDDEVRATLCPDKINTEQWLYVIEQAHKIGLRTTATIMYGHQERPIHWARHLLRIRDLQERTGGFTEFVPLPFVHMEAPVYWKGKARKGPTYREAILVHAIARLVLNPLITNIQVSWVKMGSEGIQAMLQAGANDLGGTLMNESITRAAGGEMGQEMPPAEMERIISEIGRIPNHRTTLYGAVSAERHAVALNAAELQPIVLTPSKNYARVNRRPKQEQAQAQPQ
jgi:FO synthase